MGVEVSKLGGYESKFSASLRLCERKTGTSVRRHVGPSQRFHGREFFVSFVSFVLK